MGTQSGLLNKRLSSGPSKYPIIASSFQLASSPTIAPAPPAPAPPPAPASASLCPGKGLDFRPAWLGGWPGGPKKGPDAVLEGLLAARCIAFVPAPPAPAPSVFIATCQPAGIPGPAAALMALVIFPWECTGGLEKEELWLCTCVCSGLGPPGGDIAGGDIGMPDRIGLCSLDPTGPIGPVVG
eukprot:CAMPEP_0173370204 /NCGR_PEP_ID=MMETSP1144-20121109/26554_1 /TAXON_ID=483371 /ORGANISM="non described non described, Strain CCMP2298" /LENGTH=182 /DNA_ID=CAMNT_0014321725 /DNA_START=201 /DNA_END=746 /DNA_ORIENTATION=-